MLNHKIEVEKAPKHIAIVMDGNRRWSVQHGKRTISGHKQGVKALRSIVKASYDFGIEFITVYAFSTENWDRSHMEVKALMMLLENYLEKEVDLLVKDGVRLNIIGDTTKFSSKMQRLFEQAQLKTKDNYKITLTIAINYGGRDEICRAVNKALECKLTNVDEKSFDNLLDTSELPELDFFIRTGGERRLSNFLLWQASYTEIYFTDVLWPDFDKQELYKAVLDYQNRKRRLGR